MCLLMDKWINKMWCMHAVRQWLALRRKEILAPAPAWMPLEDNRCNRSDTKGQILRFFKQANSQRQKTRWWLPRAWVKGRMGSYCLTGMEFQSEKITKFLEVDGAYSGTMWIYLILQNLNMVKRVNFMLSIFCHNKKKNPLTIPFSFSSPSKLSI